MKNLKLLAITLALGSAVLGFAQTAPPAINYQGRLTQSTGVVVPDGLTGMRVRIFASASGGSALWDSGDLSVATKSGTFSILLGSGGMPAMSPAVFALGTVYIEVQPLGQAPLLPRQPIASVPWSLYAQTVSDGAITTSKLGDLQVTMAKLANNSVGTLNLNNLAVTTTKIAGGAITTDKIADGAVTYAKLAPGSVNQDILQDGGVSAFDIAASAVTQFQLASDPASLLKVSGGTMKSFGGTNVRVMGPNNVVDQGGPFEVSRATDETRYLYMGYDAGDYAYIDAVQVGAAWKNLILKAMPGNVGIGTTNPQAKLDVNGNAIVSGNLNVSGGASLGNLTVPNVNTSNIISPGSGGVLYLNPFAGNAQTVQIGAFQNCNLTVLGRITTSDASPTKAGPGNTWTISSDARLKKNIHPLDNSLSKLLALRGVTYQYRNPNRGAGRYPGFVAQDVQRVFPDWVTTGADGYLRVGPIGFEAYVVEAMREQEERLAMALRENGELRLESRKLHSRVDELAANNEALTARVARMERALSQLSSISPTRKNVN